MNKKERMVQRWKELSIGDRLSTGGFRMSRPGHTREVADLPVCHSGVIAAKYYAAGMILGTLTPDEGEAILRELEALQEKEPGRRYGCYRWYREETQIADTNGAFFITMPLLQLCVFAAEKVPPKHREYLTSMFRRSLVWFERECGDPQNHYSNKVLSDGAALSALAYLTHDAQAAEKAVRFCRQWNDYTETRGWGWGENVSPHYTEVILDALLLIGVTLYPADRDMAMKMSRWYHEIIRTVRFHGEKTFVPAIRSYNFPGRDGNVSENTGCPSMLCYKAGVDGDLLSRVDRDEDAEALCNYAMAWLIYEEKLSARAGEEQAWLYRELFAVENEPEVSVRKERVFDGAVAYTWKGERLRLGSLNCFPVIRGCYQFPTWGLGWQSMPLAFLAEGEQMGYARFRVDDGQILRTHPAYDRHSAYLSPALFGDAYLPAVRTSSTQNENALVAVRTMENVCNHVKLIADEWVIHRFRGEVWECGEWKCLIYPDCCAAILPLGGFDAAGENLSDRTCEILREGDALILRKILFAGDAGERLTCARLECGWAVLAFDGIHEKEELRKLLGEYRLEEAYGTDHQLPRVQTAQIRRSALLRGEQKVCEHIFDLYEGIRA